MPYHHEKNYKYFEFAKIRLTVLVCGGEEELGGTTTLIPIGITLFQILCRPDYIFMSEMPRITFHLSESMYMLLKYWKSFLVLPLPTPPEILVRYRAAYSHLIISLFSWVQNKNILFMLRPQKFLIFRVSPPLSFRDVRREYYEE